MTDRKARGASNYASGLAAEENVARYYADRGHTVAARRWRGLSGEIDLVMRGPRGLVFVEVKSARTMEAAAAAVTTRQLGRISRAAEEYLAREPGGLGTPSRIDVALHFGAGHIDLIENVMAG